jgi:hypothetical protein
MWPDDAIGKFAVRVLVVFCQIGVEFETLHGNEKGEIGGNGEDTLVNPLEVFQMEEPLEQGGGGRDVIDEMGPGCAVGSNVSGSLCSTAGTLGLHGRVFGDTGHGW